VSEEEDITAEDIRRVLLEEAEEEEEEEEAIPRPRRGRPPRRKLKVEIPKDVEESLKKISGTDALKLMHLLHNYYLSWITEAEAEKYYVTVSRAYEEAQRQYQQTMKELIGAFSQQLQQTLQPTLEAIAKTLDVINARVSALEKATRPTTIDDRLIILGAIALRIMREKLGLPKDIDAVIDYLLYESAKSYLSKYTQQEKTEEEGEKQ
jgi:hypothetical protein